MISIYSSEWYQTNIQKFLYSGLYGDTRFKAQPRNVCATSIPSTRDDFVKISFLYYSIPLVFSGLADALSFLYVLEFIISQTPANMSGMT